MKLICLVLLFLGLGCSQKNKVSLNKKILFVVTSHSKLGDTKKKTGAYISEITHPYLVFKNAEYDIDFISPRGGSVPLDGMKNIDEATKELLKDTEFMNLLKNTKKPSAIRTADYDAVYFAGGHGTMFDFPDNEKLQSITAEVYEAGGLVSGVCHGPASLVNVKLSDGSYLISGKKVSAFTDEEEEAVKLTKVVPFSLESKIKSRGAYFEKADKFKEKVVNDQRLITGQNPASARAVAKEVLQTLEKRSM